MFCLCFFYPFSGRPIRQVILETTRPIFTFFPIPQEMLSRHPIFSKIGNMTFIRQAGVPKREGIWVFADVEIDCLHSLV